MSAPLRCVSVVVEISVTLGENGSSKLRGWQRIDHSVCVGMSITSLECFETDENHNFNLMEQRRLGSSVCVCV